MNLDQVVEGLVKSYRDISGSNPSSWAVLSSDRKHIRTYWNNICHAQMRHESPYMFDDLVTGVPYNKPPALDYLHGLIVGPFKQFKKFIKLKQVDENHFIHVTNLAEFPAKVLYNFCIATRGPIEFMHVVERWQILVDLGVNRDLAYLIAARGLSDDKPTLDSKLLYMSTPSDGHWWFNNRSDWRRILDHNPEIKAEKYYKHGPSHCTPCNIIWGEHNKDELRTLTGKTVRELQEIFAK